MQDTDFESSSLSHQTLNSVEETANEESGNPLAPHFEIDGLDPIEETLTWSGLPAPIATSQYIFFEYRSWYGQEVLTMRKNAVLSYALELPPPDLSQFKIEEIEGRGHRISRAFPAGTGLIVTTPEFTYYGPKLTRQAVEWLDRDRQDISNFLDYHLEWYSGAVQPEAYPSENFFLNLRDRVLPQLRDASARAETEKWLQEHEVDEAATVQIQSSVGVENESTDKHRRTRPATLAADKRRRELVDNFMRINGMNMAEAIAAAAAKDGCSVDTVERAMGHRNR